MSKKLYEESDVQAIADAIREKNGLTDTYTVSQMAAAISAIETGGGGLPSGWATGTVTISPAAIKTDFEIEHGLGAVPNIVIFYCENNNLSANFIAGIFRVNYAEEYNEDEGCYQPSIAGGRMLYLNANNNIAQTSDNGNGMDNENTIYISSKGTTSTMFFPATPYRWIAIRLGVQ